ncbi:MAG: GIY-YIG nuclease family protein [Oceanibaculum sp.]|nr:GIY-YIG nuclease family protein [Oceanibaculum sp.]
MNVEGFEFSFVADIQPARSLDGAIAALLPQSRYANVRGDPLNRYGSGPFCKFTIPKTYKQSGVYLVMAGDNLKYVGECSNLSARFNSGYGIISPKNCFKGGQETNCRINNLIYTTVSDGEMLELWFHSSSNHKAIEAILRKNINATWNKY